MKGRMPSRRQRMLLLATFPLAAGVTFLAQPNASAAETCGYVSAKAGSTSTTVTVLTYCEPNPTPPVCDGFPGLAFDEPLIVGDGDPVGVNAWACITGL